MNGCHTAQRCSMRRRALPALCPCCPIVSPQQVFEGADWALLIGAKPRGPGMERSDLLDINGRIFEEQVRARKGGVTHSLVSFRKIPCHLM